MIEAICSEWQPVVIAAAMMLLDICTGFAGAVKTHTVDSGAMRDGLWHKAGFCCLMVVAAVYEVAVVWIDFELASAGVAIPDIPAVGIICAYIVATELVSILENLTELNPAIGGLPFVGRIATHDKRPDLTVEIEDEDAMPKGA